MIFQYNKFAFPKSIKRQKSIYFQGTVKVKSFAPLFSFQLFISTTQHLFNSIISLNSRDQVLHLYICSKQKTLEYEIY